MENGSTIGSDGTPSLTKQQAEIILAYAESNMNAVATGRKVCMSESNVSYYLSQIWKQTGKNPKRFYDLCCLVGIAAQRFGGANNEQAD